ncbi:MAG TPA: hypothetical protein VJ962_01400 [Clostridia bacterium]|nr:hypothetical protein [Clostridia bacterium]
MTNKNQDGPAVSSGVNLNNVIDDIKEVLIKHDNPKKILKEYLNNIESKIDTERMLKIHEINRENIKEMILSHPYFRNPNDYGIRLVSIMKYLKKKGVDVSIPDIDIFVDEIVKSIDSVESVEFGKYNKMKK